MTYYVSDMARPTKLTPEVQKRIIRAISTGNTRKVAAEAAGVGETTLYTWLQMGGQPGAAKLYREFRKAVTRAEAAAVMATVGLIRRAAFDSWQAAAWWLERRYPDEWGRKDRVTIEHLLEREAEAIARETGLSKEEVVRSAERILAGRSG